MHDGVRAGYLLWCIIRQSFLHAPLIHMRHYAPSLNITLTIPSLMLAGVMQEGVRAVIRVCLAILFSLTATLAVAASLEPVELAPIAHADAKLTVIGADASETLYTQASLEALPTYRVETTTPWRSDPAIFEGVLLNDLLHAHGLAAAPAILVTAENDYRVEIPKAVRDDVNILVATRVNGKAHTRRERGPIQFVIEHNAYHASERALQDHLVWMASRIEVAPGVTE